MRAGMDAAVRDQPFDCLAGDLAAERIEAREDDGAGRVVDDQLDARGGLERADVAALAPDDAPLHVVARQVHDRDGRLDRVLGRAPLNRVGDDLLRLRGRGLARLGFEPLDQVGARRGARRPPSASAGGRVPRRRSSRRRAAVRAGARATTCSAVAAAAAERCSCDAVAFSRARRSCSRRSVAASRSARARVLSASVCSRLTISCRRSRAWRSASAAISWAFSRASSAASLRSDSRHRARPGAAIDRIRWWRS